MSGRGARWTPGHARRRGTPRTQLGALAEILAAPASFVVRQGEDMGRPSELMVELVPGEPGVRVRGHASRIG